jgi:hypothetical protein
VTLLAASTPFVFAQSGRSWVDPPAETAAPPQAAKPQFKPQLQSIKPDGSAPAAQQAAPPAPEPVAPPTQAAQPNPPVPAPETPPARQSAQPSQAAPPAVTAQPFKDPDEEQRTKRVAATRAFVVSYLDSWSSLNESALEATAEFYAQRVLFHGRTVSLKSLYNEKRRFVRRWPERDYRPREDAMGIDCNSAGNICKVHAVFDFTAANAARRRSSQGTGALQLIVEFIGDKPVIVAEHSTLLRQNHKRNLALEGASND